MKNLLEFSLKEEDNFVLPKDIVQYQCEELSKMTNGFVLGKITEYDGPISDYTTGLSKISGSLGSMFEEKEVKIQSDLGELSGNKFTYEFYITSKHTTNFMYRVFFLEYGISIYPLKIVLDENIAFEIGERADITCDSEADYCDILVKILNSEKIKNVVNNLFLINKKEEMSKAALINDPTQTSNENDEI